MVGRDQATLGNTPLCGPRAFHVSSLALCSHSSMPKPEGTYPGSIVPAKLSVNENGILGEEPWSSLSVS